MSSQAVQDIEAALKDMQHLAGGRASPAGKNASQAQGGRLPSGSRPAANPLTRLAKSVLTFTILIALPFLMLVRVSLYLNVEEGFNVWLSLAGGIGATTILLLIYAALLRRRFMGKMNVSSRVSKMMLALVVVYCGYSLIYLSGANVKSEEVRSTYLSLHPSLRVATSTLVLIDRSLVVTDMAREPGDYLTMGLPVRENSLHYEQESGYVEAVDIRTLDKSEVRNFLVRAYFWVMGFKTLRHSGTADHLHVSVPR